MVKHATLAMVLLLALLASAHAQTTHSISLDGFCNTFTLTEAGFEIYGTRQGCGYTVIDGGANVHIHGFYHMTADTNDEAEIFNWFFTAAVNGVGDWYLYESVGSSYTFVNSGTYHQKKASEAFTNRGSKDVTVGLAKKH
ncbi:MAG TPA: hypothetical protein VF753_09900 [Terriglobales bacterium]